MKSKENASGESLGEVCERANEEQDFENFEELLGLANKILWSIQARSKKTQTAE